ncbi:2Fe-2S iron-sulfur cluster-binding protein [Mycolicibacterium sp.]|uniref:2Fe-2S iron-sulfur cluster-binding protein n=1 Tax=Mycolicibacterium sp. TaxID=2320850 RepID=UPI0037CA1DB5
MSLVRIEPAGVSVRSLGGESILTALARCGYSHTFGCRRGGCGTCKAQLVSGDIDYPSVVSDQVLDSDERAAGVCVTCRAVPTSDIVIRLREGDTLRCVAPMLASLLTVKNS